MKGQEKFLQQLEGAPFRLRPARKIFFQIRIQILVEPADAIMILPLAPQYIVQNPQELQRLAEALRTPAGHSGERRGDFGQPRVRGGGAVAVGQRQHRVDFPEHGGTELPGGAAFQHLPPPPFQTGSDGRSEVAAEVEHHSLFREAAGGAHRLPLHLCIKFRQIRHGAGECDPFARHENRRLRRQHGFQRRRNPFQRRSPRGGESLGETPVDPPPPQVVAAAGHELPELSDSSGHFTPPDSAP